MDNFPATAIVHWPTGPVAVCERHALGLLGLARFLGSHVGVSHSSGGEQCMNCVNEAAKEQK
jgi:hypothetical protein